jgi:ribosome maturation factor RimP
MAQFTKGQKVTVQQKVVDNEDKHNEVHEGFVTATNREEFTLDIGGGEEVTLKYKDIVR